MSKIKKGIDIISALVLETGFLKSNGEARKLLMKILFQLIK